MDAVFANRVATRASGAWLGPPGIAFAVLILTILGNATSGATIGCDLLPRWAQVVSGDLPPGAAFRALKGFGYFGGADVVRPLVVLAIWAVLGIALVVLRHRLEVRRAETAPAPRAPRRLSRLPGPYGGRR